MKVVFHWARDCHDVLLIPSESLKLKVRCLTTFYFQVILLATKSNQLVLSPFCRMLNSASEADEQLLSYLIGSLMIFAKAPQLQIRGKYIFTLQPVQIFFSILFWVFHTADGQNKEKALSNHDNVVTLLGCPYLSYACYTSLILYF